MLTTTIKKMAKLKRKKALLEQASLNSPKGDDDMVVLHGEAFEATVAMARCFKMATLHLMLHLSPKYTCRIHYGITETLNSMLLRYHIVFLPCRSTSGTPSLFHLRDPQLFLFD